jgi:hypothetical protein
MKHSSGKEDLKNGPEHGKSGSLRRKIRNGKTWQKIGRIKNTLWKEAFYPKESYRSLDSRLRGNVKMSYRSHNFFIFKSTNQQIYTPSREWKRGQPEPLSMTSGTGMEENAGCPSIRAGHSGRSHDKDSLLTDDYAQSRNPGLMNSLLSRDV